MFTHLLNELNFCLVCVGVKLFPVAAAESNAERDHKVWFFEIVDVGGDGKAYMLT